MHITLAIKSYLVNKKVFFRGHQHSVVLGGHDLLEYKGSEQKLEVEAVYVNKNYSLSGDLQGDIALVKLRYII